MGLLPISISLIVSWVCMIFDSSPVFFCWYWHNKHCSIFQTHIRYHNAGDTNRNLCIWNSILVVIYRCICCELNFSASNHAFVIQILLFFFLQIPLGLLYVFYPVFYELQLVSTFTYLEKRFSRIVRLVASFCFLLGSLVFLPIFIYVPSLAFNQGDYAIFLVHSVAWLIYICIVCSSVSGINIHIVTAIATGLCVFYTTFGGLRWVQVVFVPS